MFVFGAFFCVRDGVADVAFCKFTSIQVVEVAIGVKVEIAIRIQAYSAAIGKINPLTNVCFLTFNAQNRIDRTEI